ncbi:hypothetical protein C8R46DRAFT_1217210 [Mycena filopes]|nr:hypothetical protein C8R46DRAFT_1217210 [Mycena filopes]
MFLQLPPELIEHILVDIVSNGAPSTVAAVAACCRLLHDLVHSIWRELFLAIFDDPRPKNALKASSPDSHAPVQLTYNWSDFTSRIASANRLVAGDPTCDFAPLVDVIATAAPIPQAQTLDPVPIQRRAVVFPPLLRERPTSNNTLWLNEALAKGYPPLLAKRMFASFDPDGPVHRRPEFEDTAAGKALASLPSSPHVYTWRNRLSRITPPESDSQDAAMALRSSGSRRQYPFNPSSIVIAPTLLDEDEDIDDPDYDPDDSDSEGGNAHTHGRHSASATLPLETHPTYVFPAPHRVVPDYAFLSAARYIMEANMRDKFSMEAHFTTYGSACKQAAVDAGLELDEVVDAMQSLELLRMGGAPGFWDIWRPEVPEEQGEEDVPSSRVDKGKGKARESDEVDGWDWAGVEGEWRRVVCWLDYRDLLMHNVDIGAAGFAIDDLQETIRIFPMTLRVARYSRPPLPPVGADPQALIWRLPIIHVEGDSRGTDTDTTSARVIEGTVRMIGDGAVRWSMTSSEAAGSAAEWVTESVQVGDIGSAAGIIGMWTGAEHSSTDPLGPCWAWKVAHEKHTVDTVGI